MFAHDDLKDCRLLESLTDIGRLLQIFTVAGRNECFQQFLQVRIINTAWLRRQWTFDG